MLIPSSGNTEHCNEGIIMTCVLQIKEWGMAEECIQYMVAMTLCAFKHKEVIIFFCLDIT